MQMITSPDRQTFRALVADVAARAKARLPEAVNGRIEHAVKLVLAQDVEPQDDGSILVGSSSDALKVYRLEGTTCTCQDFQYGKAPSGWCAHRIAAGIHKRVGELLPQVPAVEPWPDNDPEDEPASEPVEAPEPAPAPAPLPEAPASVNVRLTIGGREVQWTLRDSDEARLAVRLDALLARYPVPQPPAASQPGSQLSPQQHNAAAMHRPTEGFCKVHSVQMKENQKEGRSWYSHYDETAGRWCKGR